MKVTIEKSNGEKINIQEDSSVKINKWVYILLALFLGGFGFHKFYARKPVVGIIYLLFSWTYIPAIAAFIDAIIAVGKTADGAGDIYI